LVGALACAEDVLELALFERGGGGGADHAAIGDDADAANGESFSQTVNDR